MNGLRSVGPLLREPGRPRRTAGSPSRQVAAAGRRSCGRCSRRSSPGRGVKYLMMNAPRRRARAHRGHPARARVAQRHPARARGHGRGPRGRPRPPGPRHPRARSATRAPRASSSCPSRSCCHDRPCSLPTLRRVRLADLSAAERRALDRPRDDGHARASGARARAIVEEVRDGGDAALRAANARFGGGLREPADGARPRPCRPHELREARDRLPRDLRAGLERMATQHRALPRRPGAARGAVGRGRAGRPTSGACGAGSTASRPTSRVGPPRIPRRC